MNKLKMLTAVLAAGLLGQAVPGALAQTSEAGRVRYMKRIDSGFDRYTNAPSAAQQQWLRDHLDRMAGAFSPYFDSRLSWFPNAWVYIDLYSIKKDSSLTWQHPDWILRDGAGNWLFIPWGCGGGTCPQYAGDISNPSFRRWWIDEAKRTVAKGYKGIWMDDVNMQFRVGNGNGDEIAPYDRNTGRAMTWDDWRRYMAEFVEQVRAELPGVELLHNSIWFAGPGGVRDADPYIQRQIAAADYINCERGFSDPGLTGGTGEWSLQAFLAFVDRVHAKGKSVVIDEYYPSSLEYVVADYLLISNGRDGIGDLGSTPDKWWHGWDVNLGAPTGGRYLWNGLLRRDFQGGMVLVNEPRAGNKTVTLPGTYKSVDGLSLNSVSLGAAQGAVLVATGPAPAAPAAPASPAVPVASGSQPTRYLSDHNGEVVRNGWGPMERDRSNGEQGAGDGRALSIQGVTYAKGLGVHAPSEVRYTMNGACQTFQADIGIDGEAGPYNSVTFEVWADGARLFDSGVVRKGVAARPVTVDVSGRGQISLVVTDAGDGFGSDHADWANARLNCTGTLPGANSTTAYVSDMSTTAQSNGWGPVERDRSNNEQPAGDGRPLTLNGVVYAKGLGVHSRSEVRYNLGQTCSAFLADVGLDDEAGPGGSVTFEVWSDGTKLYDSGVMVGSSPTQSLNVSVAGRNDLTLVVTDAGNGPGWDHADWANARLSCNP